MSDAVTHSHFAGLAPELSPSSPIAQDWAAYTAEQHDVWSILYARRMSTLVDKVI